MIKSRCGAERRTSCAGAVVVAGTIGLAGLLAGCGNPAAQAVNLHPRSLTPAVSTHSATVPALVSNEVLAEIDARYLMSLLTSLPPGATPLSDKAPPGTPALLRSPSLRPMTPYLATDSRFTIVPGTPAAVLAWFSAHRPAGSTSSLSGSTGGPGAMEAEIGFLWRPTSVLDERGMLLGAEAFGAGRTLVRIDTGVVYTPNRPAAESVPAGVDRIVLTVTPPTGPVRTFVVTKASSVAAMEAALAALARPDYTVQPGGPCLCGPGVNEKFVARFFLPGHATPAVVVTDSPYIAIMGVGNVNVTVGTTPEPILEDGTWSLAKVVEHITGVHFDGVPPASAVAVAGRVG